MSDFLKSFIYTFFFACVIGVYIIPKLGWLPGMLFVLAPIICWLLIAITAYIESKPQE